MVYSIRKYSISYRRASVNVTPTATDADGDTITYSETTSNLGAAGFTLNGTTGQITGTAAAVSGDTTTSFTLRATANSKTADRGFNIITENKDGSTAAKHFNMVLKL